MKALAIILIAIGLFILASAGLSRIGSLFWSSDSAVVGVSIEPTMPVWVLGLIGVLLVGPGVFLLRRRQYPSTREVEDFSRMTNLPNLATLVTPGRGTPAAGAPGAPPPSWQAFER